MHVHPCMHAYITYIHTYIHTHTHTHIHTYTHTHKHTRTRAHTHTHTHTNTQTQKHTQTHTHANTHANTHTNTHKHTLRRPRIGAHYKHSLVFRVPMTTPTFTTVNAVEHDTLARTLPWQHSLSRVLQHSLRGHVRDSQFIRAANRCVLSWGRLSVKSYPAFRILWPVLSQSQATNRITWLLLSQSSHVSGTWQLPQRV